MVGLKRIDLVLTKEEIDRCGFKDLKFSEYGIFANEDEVNEYLAKKRELEIELKELERLYFLFFSEFEDVKDVITLLYDCSVEYRVVAILERLECEVKYLDVLKDLIERIYEFENKLQITKSRGSKVSFKEWLRTKNNRSYIVKVKNEDGLYNLEFYKESGLFD